MRIGILSSVLLAAAATAAAADLTSPSGAFALTVDVDGAGTPVYSLTYKGKPVVTDSHLGLTLPTRWTSAKDSG